jgi:hypothetical protein
LAVFDGAPVESDALVGVENGALPKHGLETTHATQGVLDLDLADGLAAVSLDLLEELALGGNDLFEGGLQVGFGGSIASSTAEGSSGQRLILQSQRNARQSLG